MSYEVDFIGSKNVEKDYDAIAFRYLPQNSSRWTICVFDGGTSEVGEALAEHLNAYYLNNLPKEIDMVFCSHPDLDHASGLVMPHRLILPLVAS